MVDLAVIRRVTDEVLLISDERWLASGVWTRCRARRATTCALTNAKIRSGDWCWRPLTNVKRRAQRIKDSSIIALDIALDTP